MLAPRIRDHILSALRRGVVPALGLEAMAVGLDTFATDCEGALRRVAAGAGEVQVVRGAYGSGKTFCLRWTSERARDMKFATSEVLLSNPNTPLHNARKVYRGAMEALTIDGHTHGAFGVILNAWVDRLESTIHGEGATTALDRPALATALAHCVNVRLEPILADFPMFTNAVSGYAHARFTGNKAAAESLLAWLSGHSWVSFTAKRRAGVRGEIDHTNARYALRGVLAMLRDTGFSGLVLVLDELEAVQQSWSRARRQAAEGLELLLKDLDAGHLPGLYLVIAGTPAFFDGNEEARTLPTLAARFTTEQENAPTVGNPTTVQVSLAGLDDAKLRRLGRQVREIYAAGSNSPERQRLRCDDTFIDAMVDAMAIPPGAALSPRHFLTKLVVDVLDRIEAEPEFDPRKHYAPETFLLNIEDSSADGDESSFEFEFDL